MIYFDIPIPIPTPTPGQAQLLNQGITAIQDSQKLLETASNITALGVVALVIIFGILSVVLGRNRGKEAQTMINALAQQNTDTRETYETIVSGFQRRVEKMEDELSKQCEKIDQQHEDYRLENFKRDDRIIEMGMAFTDSNNRIADIVERLEKDGKTQDGILDTIRQDVDMALGDGTPIARRTENAAKEILEYVQKIFERVNANGELLKIVAPLLEVRDIAQEAKRKSDTHPIVNPLAKVEVQPTEGGA